MSEEFTLEKVRKEVQTQARVGAGIEALWIALAKDLRLILSKIIPNLVKDVEVIEGDGGLATVSLFHFGSGRTKSLNFYLIFLMFSIIYSLYFYGLLLLFGNDNFVKYMMVDVATMRYQKEKIVELDEALHQIGLQVVEGGHLNSGFSSYKTTFQLTAIGEKETQIVVKVVYEIEREETHMPNETIKSVLAFIQCLENHLLNGSS